MGDNSRDFTTLTRLIYLKIYLFSNNIEFSLFNFDKKLINMRMKLYKIQ